MNKVFKTGDLILAIKSSEDKAYTKNRIYKVSDKTTIYTELDNFGRYYSVWEIENFIKIKDTKLVKILYG